MLYVKSYACVNGNRKERGFRSPKMFENIYELEEERDRLTKKFHADTVDFNRIVDTGSEVLSEELLKEIFGQALSYRGLSGSNPERATINNV